MNNVILVGSFNRACTMSTIPKGDTKAFGLFRPLEDKGIFAVTALGKVADQLATITPEDVVAISGKLTSYEKNVQVFAFSVKIISFATETAEVREGPPMPPHYTNAPQPKPAPRTKPGPKPAVPTPAAPADDEEDI